MQKFSLADSSRAFPSLDQFVWLTWNMEENWVSIFKTIHRAGVPSESYRHQLAFYDDRTVCVLVVWSWRNIFEGLTIEFRIVIVKPLTLTEHSDGSSMIQQPSYSHMLTLLSEINKFSIAQNKTLGIKVKLKRNTKLSRISQIFSRLSLFFMDKLSNLQMSCRKYTRSRL